MASLYCPTRKPQFSFREIELSLKPCSNCLNTPSSFYGSLIGNWVAKIGAFKPSIFKVDYLFCRPCFNLYTNGNDVALKELFDRSPGAMPLTLEQFHERHDAVRQMMLKRIWMTDQSPDYRFGCIAGLETGTLPSLKPIASHSGDYHQALLADSVEIDELDAYRQRFVRTYSWAIPNTEALRLIVENSESGVVEYGAGTGYWSALISALGCKVRTIDLPRDAYDFKKYNDDHAPTWCEIDRNPSRLNKRTRDMSLLLVWPPEAKSMAYDALQSWKGRRLFYVGEVEGGPTGDASFFAELKEEFTLCAEVRIPTFYGLFDRLMMFERNESAA